MKLLTKSLREALPPLGATAGEEDPICIVKFFYPTMSWIWYGMEFDGADRFFGYVIGFDDELGYFTLSELMEVQDALGCPLERDRLFEPTPLSKVKAQLSRQL